MNWKHLLLSALAMLSFACGGSADLDSSMEGEVGEKTQSIRGTADQLNLWSLPEYSGQHVDRVSFDSNFTNDNFNDKALSIVNKTDQYWALYVDANYEQLIGCIRPRSHMPNLANIKRTVCDSGPDNGCSAEISSVSRLLPGVSCSDHNYGASN